MQSMKRKSLSHAGFSFAMLALFQLESNAVDYNGAEGAATGSLLRIGCHPQESRALGILHSSPAGQ